MDENLQAVLKNYLRMVLAVDYCTIIFLSKNNHTQLIWRQKLKIKKNKRSRYVKKKGMREWGRRRKTTEGKGVEEGQVLEYRGWKLKKERGT